MSMKFCPGCDDLQPLELFSQDHKREDGLQRRCKDCNKRYYRQNRERAAQYRADRRAKLKGRNDA